MADERARYFRRLKRLRNAARRWSVLGAGLVGTTAVLTPYQGIGLGDAAWAGAAGLAVALAGWRWSDQKALAAQPAPPAPDPALAGQRLMAAVERFPAGRTALAEMRRHKARYALRGSSVTAGWDRLDRAAATLATLTPRLSGPGEVAVLEAAVAEQWLRDLGQRVAGVERALSFAPADGRGGLQAAHQSLAEQFADGVVAYERLVAAAASYVAEDGHPVTDRHPTLGRLHEATDLLRGIAEGLSELRDQRTGPIQAA
jgi:hypothetical protein